MEERAWYSVQTYSGMEKAVKKNIDTGIETDEYTQILTDLHENTVFITGEINEGDKVIVTE